MHWHACPRTDLEKCIAVMTLERARVWSGTAYRFAMHIADPLSAVYVSA
jgi:hypothetical protein